MTRAEIRRKEREKKKNKATFVMTYEELEKIRKQEYEKATKEYEKKNEEIAKTILKMMIVVPTNVLINDYWEKTARKRIPKFVEDCLSLYDSLSKGTVKMQELQDLTEEYAKIRLIDDKKIERAVDDA